MTSSMKKRLWFVVIVIAALASFVGTAPICNDKDWDRVADEDDNCADMYNPQQSDEDGDLIGDACDNNTPMHESRFGHCYRTNWDGFTGPGFEDIPLTIYTPNQQFGTGRLRWPDMIHDTLEDGPLSQNNYGIWFMGQWIGVEYATATYFEAVATETNGNNVVTKIEGYYQMLDCENCDFNLTWSTMWDSTMVGDIMPADFCDLEVDDDTMADDDAADDDAVDDDLVDDDASDDDAGDDDAGDDDASGDDDNDDSGCGC